MKKCYFLYVLSIVLLIFSLSGCIPKSTSIPLQDNSEEKSSHSFECEIIADRNLELAKNPIETPIEAVRLYISSAGDDEIIQRTLLQIQELSDEICRNSENESDKLFAIAKYVSENYYYDNDAKANGVTDETICIAHTLETRRSVCMGYANLFSALCQAQGIECYIAHGGAVVTGTFSGNDDVRLHEWNVAVIDEQIIWVDTLWNTTNSYRNGEYIKGSVDAEYFDPDNDILARNHRADRIERRDYFSLLSD